MIPGRVGGNRQWSLRECEKLLIESIKWLFQQQRPEWGFSPYPFTIEPSGALGTADVISALTLPTDEGYEPRYIAFLSETRVTDRIGREETLLRRLIHAIGFIVAVQHEGVQDGGFPPLGDVFWIRRACFADATADSILALLSAKWFLQTVIIAEAKGTAVLGKVAGLESLTKQLEERVCIAIQWLWRHRFVTEEGTYFWATSEYHDSKVGRVFPTWLGCMAFHIYAREIERGFSPAKDMSYERAIEARDAAMRWLLSMFEESGFLPFNSEKRSDVSFNNTANFLSLIQSILRSDHPTSAVKHHLEAVKRTGALWLRNHMEMAHGTENDELDLTPVKLQEPYIPTTYQATYARLQSVLWAYLDLYQKDVRDSQEFNEGLLRLITEINDNPYYCLEERALVEPATSATALAIMLFRRLFHIFDYDPFEI